LWRTCACPELPGLVRAYRQRASADSGPPRRPNLTCDATATARSYLASCCRLAELLQLNRRSAPFAVRRPLEPSGPSHVVAAVQRERLPAATGIGYSTGVAAPHA